MSSETTHALHRPQFPPDTLARGDIDIQTVIAALILLLMMLQALHVAPI